MGRVPPFCPCKAKLRLSQATGPLCASLNSLLETAGRLNPAGRPVSKRGRSGELGEWGRGSQEDPRGQDKEGEARRSDGLGNRTKPKAQ